MGPAERYHCDECGKSYGTVGHLNRHKRVHTGERPYKCDQCHKSFMRKDHLDDHCFSHTTQRPFPCNQCDMKFYTKQKLKRHEALHDRPKRYSCEYCSEAFMKKTQLARHRVQHTGKQPFPCPEPDCEKAFSTPNALKRHQEHRHSLSTFLCIEPGCNADPFTKFSHLQRHLKLHRSSHPHECDKCGKRFRSSSGLNKHIPTHELPVADRMMHKCHFPGCKAAYTSSGNLGTHVRSKHLNRNAFVCQSCNARFSVKASYERHLRNLHGDGAKKQELRFFCKLCNNGFPSRAALRRHMRVEHQMSASHNHEACDTVPKGLTGSNMCNEEEHKAGFVSASPTSGLVGVSVVSYGSSEDNDASSPKTTVGETADLCAEHQKERQRKRVREVDRKNLNTDAGRGLDGTADDNSDFENQPQSKRHRFALSSDGHRWTVDVGIPTAASLCDKNHDLKARHTVSAVPA